MRVIFTVSTRGTATCSCKTLKVETRGWASISREEPQIGAAGALDSREIYNSTPLRGSLATVYVYIEARRRWSITVPGRDIDFVTRPSNVAIFASAREHIRGGGGESWWGPHVCAAASLSRYSRSRVSLSLSLSLAHKALIVPKWERTGRYVQQSAGCAHHFPLYINRNNNARERASESERERERGGSPGGYVR